VLELLQRVVLDLPDPLARDAEGAADLLERARLAAEQPVRRTSSFIARADTKRFGRSLRG